MSTILFVATRGTDDPTMATFPFELAVGAAKEGHKAQIALLGESVVTMRGTVSEEMHGFGCQPLKEALAEVIEHEIPIYV